MCRDDTEVIYYNFLQINLPCRIGKEVVISRSEAQKVWSAQLEHSLDCHGLVVQNMNKSTHY